MFRLAPSLALLIASLSVVAPGAYAAQLHVAVATHAAKELVDPPDSGSLQTPPVNKSTHSGTLTKETPQLTSKEFLIISSPHLHKVVYTSLKNFGSTFGRTYALIDSGLSEPCGIALDPLRGHLYVADRGVKKIFRYSVFVQHDTDRHGLVAYSLTTDNTRLTILSGHVVEWVAVDHNGDVFYSATDTNNQQDHTERDE
jgi:hypothetical protein